VSAGLLVTTTIIMHEHAMNMLLLTLLVLMSVV